ncbi:alpha/beta hydrolase fold domain-containing protein [Asanoa sp. WMMD1127]|uniref:alpha/beta hydrolase fold domain-containing protein n=1 Tax=Asanoa sp. WMMD1127 TaxID=3016107 RepID=UPI0024160DC7|nr:alpha/beta hydrolase fold domain-containing protein [Asanoa sp. WMMD1127]MDG4824711.1 alpha/beta hydrolase fold domain-containing protein [Asanoa sp. WMMD1127]
MGTHQPPLGVRLLQAVRKEPDWLTMPAATLDAFREAENRRRSSPLMRVVTGFPDRGTMITWQDLPLPDRVLRVRVYRPSPARVGADALPLVLHVHGGGFVGTAAQSDWINSHLAGRLPAVVVSVEHRLVAPGVPMSAAVDDGWDALRHVVGDAARWGVDPSRVALFGESAGGAVAAVSAIRARESDLDVAAQVLVNPCVDLTATALDYPSMAAHGDSPTLTLAQLTLLRRLAVPDGADAGAVSPLHADDLGRLAPALVVVPTLDPLADQGRAYARALRAAGTSATLHVHPGAGHAFLSMPGMVPAQAKAARAQIAAFLGRHLAG